MSGVGRDLSERGRVVGGVGSSSKLPLLACDVGHSQFERQGLARHRMTPCFSVSLLRRNHNFLLLVDLHTDQGFVKPLNHFPSSENYLQGLVVSSRVVEACGFRFFLHGSVEDFSARISSEIMYGYGVSFLGLQLKGAHR